MAFDGAFLHTVICELKAAEGCHVDKIYQPARDELIILLRKKGFVKRLIISARAGAARIHFTDGKYENPENPPMFCMLMRKIFASSRLVSVEQKGLERVVEMTFDTANEMGDRISPKIICELIGNSSNIILVADDGRIYDAIHRSDIEKSSRIIQPGALYEYPPSQNKLNLLDDDINLITQKILCCGDIPLSSAILRCVDGLSPLICREIAYRAYCEDISVGAISNAAPVLREIEIIKNEINGQHSLNLLYNSENTPVDFSCIPILQYGAVYTAKVFDSPSELLDSFYFERDTAVRIRRQSGDIVKLVENLIARANRRLNLRLRELQENSNREDLRINGELIKANIHLIKGGETAVRVPNFYDENLSLVEISLDPALGAAANAAKYFKEYKKSCAAVQSLAILTQADRLEIEYLESVAESLTRSKTSDDIMEIREELMTAGYIKANTQKSRRKKATPQPQEYTSREGYRIIVGKNNTQNDYITTTLANKNDMWFHTKNIHGSHVVVMCGGEEISEQTILFAARLAAENSKAKDSSNVPVDYTPIKYVKKPAGAKAGMVIYTTNKTVYVTPKEEG